MKRKKLIRLDAIPQVNKASHLYHFIYVLSIVVYQSYAYTSRLTLTLKALNFFMKTLEAKEFFQFEIIINVLVCDSIEYLCYGWIEIFVLLQRGDRLYL